jgi:hypothetical protein
VDKGYLPPSPWLAGPRYAATDFIRSSKVRPPGLSLVQNRRYAATDFSQAKAGLPPAVSGPAAPRLVALELLRHFACLAVARREGGSRARPFAGAQGFACGLPLRSRPHNGSNCQRTLVPAAWAAAAIEQ